MFISNIFSCILYPHFLSHFFLHFDIKLTVLVSGYCLIQQQMKHKAALQEVTITISENKNKTVRMLNEELRVNSRLFDHSRRVYLNLLVVYLFLK